MKATRIHNYGGPQVPAAQIAMLVDSGKLKAIVETIVPLSEVRRAQELSQTGHTRCKVILKVA